MGNYKNFEVDFVDRTLRLIAQYETTLYKYDFERQFNYTLLVNCLMGLIILPKEKAISYLPNNRINAQLKQDMGIIQSTINSDIKDLKELIIALRHSIAHCNIDFIAI